MVQGLFMYRVSYPGTGIQTRKGRGGRMADQLWNYLGQIPHRHKHVILDSIFQNSEKSLTLPT